MKYLFITLNVQDGENRHTHRVLHTSQGTDINFIAQWYASHYYGNGSERYDDWWNYQTRIVMGVRVESVIELSEYTYKLMSDIFSGNVQKPYFEIVHAGFQQGIDREEIQVHAGENGNIYLIKTDEGIIVDIYGQNDIVDTLAIFEEELNPDIEDDNEIKIMAGFDEEEVKEFKKKWGQNHVEICNNLGYPSSHSQSDELLMVDFFYIETEKKWYPKVSSMFTEKEQLIADYLRIL